MIAHSIGTWILTPQGVVKGCLRISDDRVEEVCYGAPPSGSQSVIVMPAFVDSHTHIGDSFAYPAPRGSVAEVVGPPDGYKHRALRAHSEDEKIKGMREAILLMATTGTTLFADYREEGLDGARALQRSLAEGLPRAVVLGRPTAVGTADEEVDGLLSECDGLGMSAINDWPIDDLRRLSLKCRSTGKVFSLHASEVFREEVDDILSLKPDFLVHMAAASDDDLAACAEEGVPVVVCTRSNEFFGLVPDIPRMLRAGLTVALGSDNGMIARPDMLEESKAAFRASKARGGISAADSLLLASLHGRKVLNAEGKITTEIRPDDDLVAFRVRGDDPALSLVTEGSSADMVALMRGGRVWRHGD